MTARAAPSGPLTNEEGTSTVPHTMTAKPRRLVDLDRDAAKIVDAEADRLRRETGGLFSGSATTNRIIKEWKQLKEQQSA